MPGGAHWMWRRLAICVAAAVAALSLQGLPAATSLDRFEQKIRYQLTPNRDDFSSVVVAIDTASLRAHPDWPWPRDYYATVLTRLNEAGAKAVAFDIDFSTRRSGDEEFAEAIAASSAPVYLATYRQEYLGMPEVVAEIGPNDVIKADANLATTVFPVDSDGIVRDLLPGQQFSDGFVPQLALALTGHTFDENHGIDFAQDLRALPVVSFVDILEGRDLRDIVRGKTVFVGATATELGDEFALPVQGLQPGVVLNAMAFESVHQQSVKRYLSRGWTILIILAATAAASVPLMRVGTPYYTVLNAVVFGTIFLVGYVGQAAFDVVLPTAIAYVAQLIGVAVMLAMAADTSAREVFKSRMNTEKYARILKTMMRSNHDGILLTDRNGLVESINSRAANLLGVERNDILKQELIARVPELADVGHGKPAVIELGRDGDEPRYVEASASRVTLPLSKSRYESRRSPRVLTLYILHDLTAQITAEKTERRAKEEYAAASEAKTTLISTMSHELRTPLNAVCGFADLIADGAFGEHTSPEYSEFGGLIRSAGKQLLAVVNDMLLAARFQSGEVEVEKRKFDLRVAVDTALDRAKNRQSWTSPTVKVDVPEINLNADYELVLTAIGHLIDNAAKFAGPNGTIWLSGDAESATLRVEDNGPGIGDMDPAPLTDLFVQGDGSKTRSHEGCGLGLFLVKNIFGTVVAGLTLANREGGGFAATVDLSRATASAKEEDIGRAA